jgi:hypothetical protein
MILGLIGCGNNEPNLIYVPVEDQTEETITYSWEKERTKILNSTDMVLIYGGGHHRTPYRWDMGRLNSYVIYTDKKEQTHYLFDSFLFIEFLDGGSGGNKIFATGYGTVAATQSDWNDLINYWFEADKQIGALDKCIREASTVLGKPKYKHQIVICIPEPIVHQNPNQMSSTTKYWGEVNGVMLDFSVTEDRVKACKWFINRVRAKFNEMKYQYVDLAGFYWLAEESTHTKEILTPIATYLNGLKYSFNWIPYFAATGYDQWKSYGFNYAYLQPNYFFNASTPYSRLGNACQRADNYDMDLELEFDEDVLAGRGKAGKLRDYMAVFKEKGVWQKKRIAYYQGNEALWALKNSINKDDQELYHDFCNFVVSRSLRTFQ